MIRINYLCIFSIGTEYLTMSFINVLLLLLSMHHAGITLDQAWKYLTIQDAAQMAQEFYHRRPNVGTDWMMSDVKTGGIFRADHLFEGVLAPQITANSKA
jgi:hypothetical protein